MSRSVRDVIVHYHIFKNAGTSIDGGLRESFGGNWATLEGVSGDWINVTTEDMVTYLQAHPRVRAFSSHSARWPEPDGDGIRTHPIVFLRHPIDRVGSLYGHRLRQPGGTAYRESLREFVERNLRPEVWFRIRSFQTFCLSDEARVSPAPGAHPAEVTAEHFASALRRLQDLRAFGLVDRFRDSIRVIETELRPTFPELRLLPRRENVTAGRADSLGSRIREIAGTLGSSLYHRLVNVNEADLELYAVGQRILAERIGGHA